MIPLITQGQITAIDPPNGVMVLLKNVGQMGSYRCSILRDYADAVRVRQKPMPQLGTWGLVIFPSGDLRNGVWMGSYYPSLMDALTTTQASGFAPTDPYLDYEATFPGEWWLLDGKGHYAKQWTDSSYFTAAPASGLPTVYRHTVENNKQKTVKFTYAERIASPPASGFLYDFHHKSGTDISVDPSGNVSVSGAPAANLTIKFGGATLTINASGLASLALPGVQTFNITQGGGSPMDFLVLVSKFLTKFNAHVHPTGGGNTGPPTVSLSAADVDSTIIKISN